jgi:DNA repair photolyase
MTEETLPKGPIYIPRGRALEYSELACNIYEGCPHECGYCYAPEVLHRLRSVFHAQTTAKPGIVGAVRRALNRMPAEHRTKRVLLCFTSDPYPFTGDVETREVLKLFVEHGQPWQVLTKAGTRACRDFDLYREGDGWFATTLLFTGDADRARWEPRAASVEDRIRAIVKAHKLGIRTWVSIEPVISPAQALALIRKLTPYVDGWKVGKLNHLEPPQPIDWSDFARRALELLQASGREWMIKHDLAAHLDASAPRRGGPSIA